MNSTPHRPDKPLPQAVPIPDELREFLEVVHLLSEGLDNGTYTLDNEHERLCWDDITWSLVGVFRERMIGFPYENRSEFEFRYQPYFGNGVTEWEFDLSREEVARIAAGDLRELALYVCAHPLCGYRSSNEYEHCPRCNLQAGAAITSAQAQRVLGICPYCNQLLRTLYARQCPHCLKNWHDREGATNSQER